MSDEFETHIREIASELLYPAMPNHKKLFFYPKQLMRRVAVVVLLIGLVGFAVPDIRARVLEVLRIGQVTITLDGHTSSGGKLRLEDVYGETDIATIEESISFELSLPTEDLPDKVYLQDDDLVIFVWLDAHDIEQVLYQVPDNDWGIYKSANSITVTQVNENNALWLDIQHPVRFVNGAIELTYFVDGNVLIWTDGIVTYRLETALDMESASAFAEELSSNPSLNPSP